MPLPPPCYSICCIQKSRTPRSLLCRVHALSTSRRECIMVQNTFKMPGLTNNLLQTLTSIAIVILELIICNFVEYQLCKWCLGCICIIWQNEKNDKACVFSSTKCRKLGSLEMHTTSILHYKTYSEQITWTLLLLLCVENFVMGTAISWRKHSAALLFTCITL